MGVGYLVWKVWNMWKVLESGEGSGYKTDAVGYLSLDVKKAVLCGTDSSSERVCEIHVFIPTQSTEPLTR